jgi:AraC-like DNA-binding protein
LAIREFLLPPGGEWEPRLPGWSLIQVGQGSGYWLHQQSNNELPAGSLLLLPGRSQPGSIRASQVSGLSLSAFIVDPRRLTGLITLGEQSFLETAAGRQEFSFQMFSPDSQPAVRMKELCSDRNLGGFSLRLQLLQLFVDVFGDGFTRSSSGPEETPDAKERLRQFLKQTPAAELLHIDFSELAQTTCCTPRHFSRIFHAVVGMSFRDKRAELRLARACELLATSESKVVEIALESGFQSLSLFNLMFTRRFGLSPGKWRQKHRTGKIRTIRRWRKNVFALARSQARSPDTLPLTQLSRG